VTQARVDCWERGVTITEDDIAAEQLLRTDLEDDREGGLLERTEPWTAHPERIFQVQVGGRWWLGLKTVSDYVVHDGIPGVFCSRIRWANLVGPLRGTRVAETGVRVRATWASPSERRAAFAGLDAAAEVMHPFPHLDEAGQETGTPADGWFVTEERADFLGTGELHLRVYTQQRLRDQWPTGRPVVAFDPACSTGQFLAEFAASSPAAVHTVGQDLSAEMVSYARPKLDRVACGDALNPQVETGSVDVLFARFLNSEVVTTSQAGALLNALVPTLRPGGLLVAFGHTPVLLDRDDLESRGLRVQQCLGRFKDDVFQYYIAIKEA